jgi:hypothetical protein
MLTYPHDDNNIKNNKLVPEGAVNLSYYNMEKPSIINNTFISTEIENKEIDYIEITKDIISVSSRYFLLTDKIFVEGNGESIPLFYAHKLNYEHFNLDPNDLSIINDNVDNGRKFKIEIVEVEAGIFVPYVFTNFMVDEFKPVYIVYNAIIDGKVNINHKELLQPMPYMKRKDINNNLKAYEYYIEENEYGYFNLVRPNENFYYLFPLDSKSIALKEPISIDGKWLPRIINGTVEKYIPDLAVPKRATYRIPDYYEQDFSSLGQPYMEVTEEPEVIGINSIRLKNKFIVNDSVIVNVNSVLATVVNVDKTSGIIKLNRLINEVDEIEVTYKYIEDAYIYNGYTYSNLNGIDVFVPLDLNPIYDKDNPELHEYGYINEEGILIIEPSFKLLNKTVYLYIKPNIIRPVGLSGDEDISINSIIEEEIGIPETNRLISYLDIQVDRPILKGKFDTEIRTKYSNVVIVRHNENISNSASWDYVENNNRAIRIHNVRFLSEEPIIVKYLTNNPEESVFNDIEIPNNVIFHTIKELTIEELKENSAILIGRIFVRPHINKNNINLIDTRTRGGGVIETNNEILNELNMELDYYYDIGNTINGEPIQKNSVIIVNVDSSLLEENGGEFTDLEIKNAIEKYKAVGILPIIRYVDQLDHREII